MLSVQYDLFKEPHECELECLHDEIAKIRKSSDAVRKGTYARLNSLAQQYVDLSIRVDLMERHVCHGDDA